MNTSQRPPEISVVSPVYGAPELVAPLVDRLQVSLDALDVRYEVLLVNDACPRGSW